MDSEEKDLIPVKQKNKKVIVGVIISIILIITLILTNTIQANMSKTFVELLIEDNNINEIIKERVNSYEDTKETNYNITIKNDFLTTLDSIFILLNNDLMINTNVLNENENIEVNSVLNFGELELQNVNIIKQNDLIALSVPNLYENYIAFSDEYKNKFSIAKDKEIDMKTLNKYYNILLKHMNKKIELIENEVNINEKMYYTQQYTISLSENDINLIIKDILQKLKDDKLAIETLVKIINKYSNNELSTDELSNKLSEVYANLPEENINEDKSIEIILNVKDKKTLKTTIKVTNNDETLELVFIGIKDNKEDYIFIEIKPNESYLNLEYKAQNIENNYNGKINLITEGVTIEVAEIYINKILESDKKVKNINDLEYLLLDKATEEELNNLKEKIKINLGLSSEETQNLYEEGEFKLENPNEQIKILEDSINAYNKINIGMSKDEVINVLGEPSAEYELEDVSTYGWYYDEEETIYFISVEMIAGKVYKVYNDIVSDMTQNIKISAELKTEIDDITKYSDNIDSDMSKAEIIELLGDKYLEIAKDENGYKTYKWYDKNENILVIEFDSDEMISNISNATMDI